jgi:hypothetical protein
MRCSSLPRRPSSHPKPKESVGAHFAGPAGAPAPQPPVAPAARRVLRRTGARRSVASWSAPLPNAARWWRSPRAAPRARWPGPPPRLPVGKSATPREVTALGSRHAAIAASRGGWRQRCVAQLPRRLRRPLGRHRRTDPSHPKPKELDAAQSRSAPRPHSPIADHHRSETLLRRRCHSDRRSEVPCRRSGASYSIAADDRRGAEACDRDGRNAPASGPPTSER